MPSDYKIALNEDWDAFKELKKNRLDDPINQIQILKPNKNMNIKRKTVNVSSWITQIGNDTNIEQFKENRKKTIMKPIFTEDRDKYIKEIIFKRLEKDNLMYKTHWNSSKSMIIMEDSDLSNVKYKNINTNKKDDLKMSIIVKRTLYSHKNSFEDLSWIFNAQRPILMEIEDKGYQWKNKKNYEKKNNKVKWIENLDIINLLPYKSNFLFNENMYIFYKDILRNKEFKTLLWPYNNNNLGTIYNWEEMLIWKLMFNNKEDYYWWKLLWKYDDRNYKERSPKEFKYLKFLNWPWDWEPISKLRARIKKRDWFDKEYQRLLLHYSNHLQDLEHLKFVKNKKERLKLINYNLLNKNRTEDWIKKALNEEKNYSPILESIPLEEEVPILNLENKNFIPEKKEYDFNINDDNFSIYNGEGLSQEEISEIITRAAELRKVRLNTWLSDLNDIDQIVFNKKGEFWISWSQDRKLVNNIAKILENQNLVDHEESEDDQEIVELKDYRAIGSKEDPDEGWNLWNALCLNKARRHRIFNNEEIHLIIKEGLIDKSIFKENFEKRNKLILKIKDDRNIKNIVSDIENEENKDIQDIDIYKYLYQFNINNNLNSSDSIILLDKYINIHKNHNLHPYMFSNYFKEDILNNKEEYLLMQILGQDIDWIFKKWLWMAYEGGFHLRTLTHDKIPGESYPYLGYIRPSPIPWYGWEGNEILSNFFLKDKDEYTLRIFNYESEIENYNDIFYNPWLRLNHDFKYVKVIKGELKPITWFHPTKKDWNELMKEIVCDDVLKEESIFPIWYSIYHPYLNNSIHSYFIPTIFKDKLILKNNVKFLSKTKELIDILIDMTGIHYIKPLAGTEGWENKINQDIWKLILKKKNNEIVNSILFYVKDNRLQEPIYKKGVWDNLGSAYNKWGEIIPYTKLELNLEKTLFKDFYTPTGSQDWIMKRQRRSIILEYPYITGIDNLVFNDVSLDWITYRILEKIQEKSVHTISQETEKVKKIKNMKAKYSREHYRSIVETSIHMEKVLKKVDIQLKTEMDILLYNKNINVKAMRYWINNFNYLSFKYKLHKTIPAGDFIMKLLFDRYTRDMPLLRNQILGMNYNSRKIEKALNVLNLELKDRLLYTYLTHSKRQGKIVLDLYSRKNTDIDFDDGTTEAFFYLEKIMFDDLKELSPNDIADLYLVNKMKNFREVEVDILEKVLKKWKKKLKDIDIIMKPLQAEITQKENILNNLTNELNGIIHYVQTKSRELIETNKRGYYVNPYQFHQLREKYEGRINNLKYQVSKLNEEVNKKKLQFNTGFPSRTYFYNKYTSVLSVVNRRNNSNFAKLTDNIREMDIDAPFLEYMKTISDIIIRREGRDKAINSLLTYLEKPLPWNWYNKYRVIDTISSFKLEDKRWTEYLTEIHNETLFLAKIKEYYMNPNFSLKRNKTYQNYYSEFWGNFEDRVIDKEEIRGSQNMILWNEYQENEWKRQQYELYLYLRSKNMDITRYNHIEEIFLKHFNKKDLNIPLS